MLKAYLNYPNPKVSTHRDPTCGAIGKMQKGGQRRVRINPTTLSSEIQGFARKEYRFASDATANDMWIELDFGDAEFERAVLAYIHRLVSRHCTRFGEVSIEHHC